MPESRITTAPKPKHSLKTPLESLLGVFASHRRHKKTPLGSPKGVSRSVFVRFGVGKSRRIESMACVSQPTCRRESFRSRRGKRTRSSSSSSSSSSPYASSSSTISALTASFSESTPTAARYLPAISAEFPSARAGRSVLWVTTVSLGASLQPRFALE